MDDRREKILTMSDQQFREFVDDQLRIGDEKFIQLKNELKNNTELTKKNIEATAELVSIFKSAKTGVSVFAWLGRNFRKVVTFVYPFILIAAAIAAIWHGKWPKLGE
jgi:hypothetical protein